MRVPAASAPVPLASGAPPLTRRRSARFVAGVAGGVADHLGVNVLWVRAAFVVLCRDQRRRRARLRAAVDLRPAGGRGVQRPFGRAERQQALGLAALGIGAGLAAAALGNTVVGWIVGPLGVAAVGAAVVWREADESQRRRWTAGARSGVTGVAGSGRAALWRVLAGALFVATGIGVFLLGNLDLAQVQFGLLAVLATLLGVGVLTVPWWVRLMRELGEERRERIIETERAEIAAHLHDSVLQTLALIQRQSDQPREVLRLARGQERELRHWLYGPTGYGRSGRASGDPALDAGLAAAITAAAAEVEDTYAIDVRPVVVGDRPLDDGLRALVLAAREAMVNAAKHAAGGRGERLRRGRAGRGARVRTRPGRRLRPGGRARPTGTASPTRCTAGWSGTAAPCACAAHRARAPRCT